jgi:hypothetical protein
MNRDWLMKRRALAVSRRAAVGSFAALVLSVSTLPAAASSTDAHLLLLGRDFDAVTARLDHAIASGTDFDDDLLQQLDHLSAEIANTQASTMEGLCVKARAACWASLGDLDDPADSTTDRRMAISIVRDLIRLYEPCLEKPGALKQLVEDIESSACNSNAA